MPKRLSSKPWNTRKKLARVREEHRAEHAAMVETKRSRRTRHRPTPWWAKS